MRKFGCVLLGCLVFAGTAEAAGWRRVTASPGRSTWTAPESFPHTDTAVVKLRANGRRLRSESAGCVLWFRRGSLAVRVNTCGDPTRFRLIAYNGAQRVIQLRIRYYAY